MRTTRLSIPLTVLAWLASAGFLAMVGAVVSPGALSSLSVAAWGAAAAVCLVQALFGVGRPQAAARPGIHGLP